MKEVIYRGGLIRFSIPDHWIEETGSKDALGVYYEEGPDTPTLSLHVETARSSEPVTPQVMTALLQALAPDATQPTEHLANGNLLLRTLHTWVENGKALAEHCWMVGNLVPPHYVRLANFRYTADTSDLGDPATLEEIAQLEVSIRAAIFARTVGNLS